MEKSEIIQVLQNVGTGSNGTASVTVITGEFITVNKGSNCKFKESLIEISIPDRDFIQYISYDHIIMIKVNIRR